MGLIKSVWNEKIAHFMNKLKGFGGFYKDNDILPLQ